MRGFSSVKHFVEGGGAIECIHKHAVFSTLETILGRRPQGRDGNPGNNNVVLGNLQKESERGGPQRFSPNRQKNARRRDFYDSMLRCRFTAPQL